MIAPGIIIPYRDRKEHLASSAPILKQFGPVYVIEQIGKHPFNRGKLINVGFLEFRDNFYYFAAHDVDMIPQALGYYEYSSIPCHIATQTEQFGYKMPYERYFGGVTLFPNDKFEQVNGFSNEFWGWGGEDDYLRRKIEAMSIPIKSRQCKFSSLTHSRQIDNTMRLANAKKAAGDIDWEDGLTSCKYEVVNVIEHHDYVLLQVKI